MSLQSYIPSPEQRDKRVNTSASSLANEPLHKNQIATNSRLGNNYFKDRPKMHSTPTKMSTSAKCNTCQKTEGDLGKKLLYCAKCKTPYCSPECQKSDWKSHKPLCSFLKFKSEQPASGPSGPHNGGFDAVNHFLGLSKDDYLHQLSEKEAMNQLIDCFRMRCEDEYTFGGNTMGLYNEEDPRHEFSAFLNLAEKRAGLLPSWWSPLKRLECFKLALDDSNWSDINCAVEKSDVQEHYGDYMMPMKLRVLGEKIYGKGFM